MPRPKAVTPSGDSLRAVRSFGVALAAELHARGEAANALSVRAGLGRNDVGKIIRGENANPSLATVAAILTALGKPWAWLDEI